MFKSFLLIRQMSKSFHVKSKRWHPDSLLHFGYSELDRVPQDSSLCRSARLAAMVLSKQVLTHERRCQCGLGHSLEGGGVSPFVALLSAACRH